MAYERISEVLHEPLKDVSNDGNLLGITRLNGETEDTYRTRVAYGMQAKLYKARGRSLTPRIIQRMQDIEIQALTEAGLCTQES